LRDRRLLRREDIRPTLQKAAGTPGVNSGGRGRVSAVPEERLRNHLIPRVVLSQGDEASVYGIAQTVMAKLSLAGSPPDRSHSTLGAGNEKMSVFSRIAALRCEMSN